MKDFTDTDIESEIETEMNYATSLALEVAMQVLNERTVNVRSCSPCTCMSIAGSQCGCPRLRKVGRHARGLHLRPALEGQD